MVQMDNDLAARLERALGPITIQGTIGDLTGRASARWHVRTAGGEAVVKRSTERIEVAREAAFYASLAPQLALRLPRLLHVEEDAIVLEFVPGAPGDCLVGCPPAWERAWIDAAAELHRTFAGRRPPEVRTLVLDPAAREARVRECMPDFRRWMAVEPDWEPWIDALDTRAAAATARLARLPATVIHSDLHVENVLFTDTGPVLIDWQTVAWGPGVIDLARQLCEGLSPDHAHLDHYRTHLPVTDAQVADALDALLAGMVCSRWFRQPGGPTPRARALVARGLSTWVAARALVPRHLG